MVRSPIFVLEFFLMLCCFCNPVLSDYRSRRMYDNSLEHGRTMRCSATPQNATASFQNNLNLLVSDFTVKSSLQSFYNTSIGNIPDRVYGYYMCRGDLSQKACENCIFSGTQFASGSHCKHVDGTFFAGNCLLAFSNQSMYRLLDIHIASSYNYVRANVSNYRQFNATLSSTITAVINEASSGRNSDKDGSVPGFATKEANVTGEETIYSMAQCTPDILGANCSLCLTSAFSILQQNALGAPAATAFMVKCQLRYDNIAFYESGKVED